MLIEEGPLTAIQTRIRLLQEQLDQGQLPPEEREEVAELLARWKLRLAHFLFEDYTRAETLPMSQMTSPKADTPMAGKKISTLPSLM